ncbi:hypothetical protein CsSME_00037354 [Camellia sinensis var. sinensis]
MRASGGKRGCCVNGKGSGVQEQQQQRQRRRRRRRREGGDRDDMRESGVLLSSLVVLGLLFRRLNISVEQKDNSVKKALQSHLHQTSRAQALEKR